MFKLPKTLTIEIGDTKYEINVSIILFSILAIICMFIVFLEGYDKGYREGAYWGYENCTTEFNLPNRYSKYSTWAVSLKDTVNMSDTRVSSARDRCFVDCMMSCCPDCRDDAELDHKCPQCRYECDFAVITYGGSMED